MILRCRERTAAATFAVPPSAFGIPTTGTSKTRQRHGTSIPISLAQTSGASDQHLGDQAQSDYSMLIWRSASPGDTEGDANGCTVEVGSAPSALSLSLTEL